MANDEHLKILKQGIEVWNRWREDNFDLRPDLSGINLSAKNLHEANFRRSNLHKTILQGSDLSWASFDEAFISEATLDGADLRHASFAFAILNSTHLVGAYLHRADFQDADLGGADLHNSQMSESNFSGANLRKANLHNVDLFWAALDGADLREADLSKADLHETNLSSAILVNTNLSDANLTGCNVYGLSAWDLNLTNTIQKNLDISPKDQTTITVDNLEVAQFIYLMLHNEKIRDVIDTIGKKAVLILGRFTPKRKKILDALREELRKRDYLPILFDFDKPGSKDLTETVSTLAHMSRFVIADITDAKSIPQELQAIVPNLPSVAVQPLIHIADREYAMFEHFKRYPWVLPILEYDAEDTLIKNIGKKVIEPAEAKVKELKPK